MLGSLKSCSLLLGGVRVARHQAVLPVCLHTSSVAPSRIKKVQRHKPLWHIKKLNKAEDAPISGDNRDFIQEVISDQYSGECHRLPCCGSKYLIKEARDFYKLNAIHSIGELLVQIVPKS